MFGFFWPIHAIQRQVTVKSFIVVGHAADTAPVRMSMWINREDIDFNNCRAITPAQVFDVHFDPNAQIEYPTQYVGPSVDCCWFFLPYRLCCLYLQIVLFVNLVMDFLVVLVHRNLDFLLCVAQTVIISNYCFRFRFLCGQDPQIFKCCQAGSLDSRVTGKGLM